MGRVFKLNSADGQNVDGISVQAPDTPRGVVKVTADGAERTGVSSQEYISQNDVVGHGAQVTELTGTFDGGKITDLSKTSGHFGLAGRGHTPVENNSVAFAQPKSEISEQSVTAEMTV